MSGVLDKHATAIYRRTIDWAKPLSEYSLSDCAEALGVLGGDLEGIEARLRELGRLDYWCDVHGDLSAFESPGSAIRKAAAELGDHGAD